MLLSFCQSKKLFWLLLPFAFLPLCIPSNEPRTWASIGRGWPWHYGWQLTDRGTSSMPRIENLTAFFGDFLLGFALVLSLWLVLRHLSGRGQP